MNKTIEKQFMTFFKLMQAQMNANPDANNPDLGSIKTADDAIQVLGKYIHTLGRKKGFLPRDKKIEDISLLEAHEVMYEVLLPTDLIPREMVDMTKSIFVSQFGREDVYPFKAQAKREKEDD